MTSLQRKYQLFWSQSLDTVSDYDLVDNHTNSWRELDSIDERARERLLDELENQVLTAPSKKVIKRLFLTGITDHHLLTSRISSVFSYFSLLSFIVVDALIVPDVVWMATAYKILIISPISLYCIFFADKGRSQIGTLIVIWFILTELMLVFIMATSSSLYTWVYGFGIAVVCADANLVQAVPTRRAFAMTVTSVFLSIVGFVFCQDLPIFVAIYAAASTSLLCLFSLTANYRLEIVSRRQYIHGLHQKLQADKLASVNKTLNERASIDGVTGIANRRMLDEELAALYSSLAKTGKPLGLLMIDIDHFKLINDQYGHLAGDEVLRQVATLLASNIRSDGDMVARYGGEEFVVLLPGITRSDCLAFAERLRQTIANHQIRVDSTNELIRLTVSIGCQILVPSRGGVVVELIAQADAAVYAAKKQGRNRVCAAEVA